MPLAIFIEHSIGQHHNGFLEAGNIPLISVCLGGIYTIEFITVGLGVLAENENGDLRPAAHIKYFLFSPHT